MKDYSQLLNKAPEFDLRVLLEAGCHFGHQKAKWHPLMSEWVYMEKDGVHIFDLAKTAQQLTQAFNYAYQLGKSGKNLIIVGTKKQASEIVEEVAGEAGVMHVTTRWLGGLLSNWEQVKKSITRMRELEEGLKTGKYEGYTKYERMQMEKELIRLKRFFGGIKDMKKVPDALFIIDPKREKNAVAEARGLGIPVIALIDSNSDPRHIDLPIPANDDALKSIRFIVEQVIAGYAMGKSEVGKKEIAKEVVKKED
jgi:small subunit ribosomal protein S2